MTEKENPLLGKTIEALAESKRYGSLKDIFITMNPADIAAIFDELPEKIQPLLFRLLPKELAADTFVEMEPETQELLIRGFSDSELKAVIDELFVDDAVDIVEEMPAIVVKRILKQADPEMRRMINEILNYPEDSAGSIMTTEYVDLHPAMTVSDAVRHIKKTGVDKETINTCYVTDSKRCLIGIVSIRMLILADDESTVGDIMESHVISVITSEDKESVAQMFVKYDFTALPVVDNEGRLVGIVTADDAIDVLVDEATEDIEKMAAITPSDRPYLKTSVISIYANRIPWLLLLMISATFTCMILTHFEDSLSALVVLTAYIPMLMDTGGNSGSQASVTIIRALSLNELDFKDIFRVIWKEIRVSCMCALTLGAVNFVKLMFVDKVGLLVAVVICLTLAATVLVAKMVGCSLPMLAKRAGFDPAVCASPFITTIVDALSLLIYLSVARQILGI
ncbi:MAG: magnesium transporter [Oscillospiraceae bacterium]|nr:magnesium transporter [Oscillospiraceae bacterium]